MTGADGATLHQGKAWGVDKEWVGVKDIYVGKSVTTMGDVRTRLFRLIEATPNLDWLLLTKRPENACRMMGPDGVGLYAHADGPVPRPQPNVWIGTSVENQEQADERIPHLFKTPAAVRFLSCEPLLGPVDLSAWIGCDCPRNYPWPDGPHNRWCKADRQSYLPRPDWVIVGSESGHARRPMETEWATSIVDQCRTAGVKVFMKQMEMGGKVTGEVENFPLQLQVREFPR